MNDRKNKKEQIMMFESRKVLACCAKIKTHTGALDTTVNECVIPNSIWQTACCLQSVHLEHTMSNLSCLFLYLINNEQINI